MQETQIAGIIRAVVSALGGYLVGRGFIDEANSEVIMGAVVTIGTAAWSVWAKSGKKK